MYNTSKKVLYHWFRKKIKNRHVSLCEIKFRADLSERNFCNLVIAIVFTKIWQVCKINFNLAAQLQVRLHSKVTLQCLMCYITYLG